MHHDNNNNNIMFNMATRSSHHPSFVCPYARTCYYFNLFAPRTVRLWNALPISIINNPTTSICTLLLSLAYGHMFY